MQMALADKAHEIDTLARTIYGEARGEGIVGMIAVACVIVNRARKPGWWGYDVITCCTTAFQFSCWLPSDVNHDKIMAVTDSDKMFVAAQVIAEEAVMGMLYDPTKGADSYYAPVVGGVQPPWAQPDKELCTIGGHRFYKTTSGINSKG